MLLHGASGLRIESACHAPGWTGVMVRRLSVQRFLSTRGNGGRAEMVSHLSMQLDGLSILSVSVSVSSCQLLASLLYFVGAVTVRYFVIPSERGQWTGCRISARERYNSLLCRPKVLSMTHISNDSIPLPAWPLLSQVHIIQCCTKDDTSVTRRPQ